MDLTEARSRSPKNRFTKNKITIGIPDSVYVDLSKWLHEYEEINKSPEEIKANPRTAIFIERSFEYFLADAFSEGWENMDIGEELGYASEADRDFDDENEDYGEMVATPGDDDWIGE